MKNNWISIKKKLPEYDLPVIVCSETGRVRGGYRTRDDASPKSGVWYDNHGYVKVTHWMPLPSTPIGLKP